MSKRRAQQINFINANRAEYAKCANPTYAGLAQTARIALLFFTIMAVFNRLLQETT